MFWTKFAKLCSDRGVAANTVAAQCGVKSTGTVSGWKKGATPRESILIKIADYFGITVEELLGENEQKKETTALSDGLSDEKIRLIKFIETIPDNKIAAIYQLLQSIVEIE